MRNKIVIRYLLKKQSTGELHLVKRSVRTIENLCLSKPANKVIARDLPTFLYDNTETSIFENDILENQFGEIGLVMFNQSEAKFEIIGNDDIPWVDGIEQIKLGNVKIIGNTHFNIKSDFHKTYYGNFQNNIKRKNSY
ncbi:MAG: hypothetical protein WC755_08810 [Candidatus Woesearchaeota archaeon]|jgi:hypothetical protein